LAARGFDQAYINAAVTRGVPGTSMPAFGPPSLSFSDVNAAVAYVATLNGITNPTMGGGRGGGRGASQTADVSLSADAAQGRTLFFNSLLNFSRCSTCHEVEGIGIPVTVPISKVPADAKSLRSLTPNSVQTVTIGNESMPALILSQGKLRTVFYDLTKPPPVQRTADPATVKVSPNRTWQHASVTEAYTEAELTQVLAYLHSVIQP
jgi:mono/diheme cytochrome c family protein